LMVDDELALGAGMPGACGVGASVSPSSRRRSLPTSQEPTPESPTTRLATMSDEPRSHQSPEAAASEDVNDLPWEKLADGELSATEEAALRATAERSEEGRKLFEQYRPFDADEKQQIFDAVRARVRQVRRQRRRRRVTMAVIAIVLVAVVLILRSRHDRRHDPPPAPTPYLMIRGGSPSEWVAPQLEAAASGEGACLCFLWAGTSCPQSGLTGREGREGPAMATPRRTGVERCVGD
jgi:hypothetical protein